MAVEDTPITFAERMARIDAQQASLRNWRPGKRINPGVYLLTGFALGAGSLWGLLLTLGARL